MNFATIRGVMVFLAVAAIGAEAVGPPAAALKKAAAAAAAAAAKTVATTLQLKKFRFQNHEPEQFERLVLEFQEKSQHAKPPAVKVTPGTGGGDTTVEVSDCQWVGAIPEASINDAYAPRSKYLGKIAVSTDNPKALTLKLALKNADASVDAFWLRSPSRLVLDVFPQGSPRASGPQILKSATRSVAQEESPRASRASRNGFSCFPANAELNGAVKDEGDQANEEEMEIRIDTAVVQSPEAKSTAIQCYPRKAELHAKIVYEPPKVEKATPKKEALPVAAAPTKASTEAPSQTTLTPKPLLGNNAPKTESSVEAKAQAPEKEKVVASKPVAPKTESAAAANKSTAKQLDEEDEGAVSDINIVTGSNGNPQLVKEKDTKREVSTAKHLDAGPLLDIKSDDKKSDAVANPGSLLPPLK